MTVTLPFEEIRTYRAKLLKAEKPFKQKIRSFLENSVYGESLTTEDRTLFQQYADAEYIYFNNDHYLEDEVKVLSSLIERYQALLNEYYLSSKQELLNLQIELNKVS